MTVTPLCCTVEEYWFWADPSAAPIPIERWDVQFCIDATPAACVEHRKTGRCHQTARKYETIQIMRATQAEQEAKPLRRYDSRPRSRMAQTAQRQQRCLALFREGKTTKEVSAITGIARSTIYAWRSTHPDYAHALNEIAEDRPHHRAAQRPVNQQRVLALVREGKSLKEASASSGIHIQTIRAWRRADPEFAAALAEARREAA